MVVKTVPNMHMPIEPRKRKGFALEPTRRLCLLDLQPARQARGQPPGEALCNLSVGWGMGEGRP